MPKTDPRVDAYIDRAADFAKPILTHLRRLVHEACPDVEETWKWSFPNFKYKGMILCNMAAFKAHCAFGFWHKSIRDQFADEKSNHAFGQLGRITSLRDLPNDAVMKRYLKEAVKLNEQGVKSGNREPRKPAAVKIPVNVKAALSKNAKAAAHFKKLSPSHQREYIEWIEEAKREETVQKRLATMLEWLAEGKSRNWKYETK